MFSSWNKCFQGQSDVLKFIADRYFEIRVIYFQNSRYGTRWLDWIPRIFRDLESMEITFFGPITLIELIEIFKIDPIFFEYSWIFSNKIVFEMVFYIAFLAAWSRIDMLCMFRISLSYCIRFWLWLTGADRGLGAITWFINFTGVENA